MRDIITVWHAVNQYMPPNDATYRIVRTINKDGEYFYLVAFFEYSDCRWKYFNNINQDEMEITHWCDINENMFKKSFRMVETGVQLL